MLGVVVVVDVVFEVVVIAFAVVVRCFAVAITVDIVVFVFY